MKSLADYAPTTPAAELYHFLAENIIAKRITSFAGLLQFAKDLPLSAKTTLVYRRLFQLIRRLYWGFFADVSPEAHPKIWKAIVIPQADFEGCGDLKRNLTISDVFVGFVDLHGYTRFCEKNKHNLSMLRMLDDLIQTDVVNIARERNVLLQRRQGDQMILVGASALDMVTTVLLIMGHFSKRRQIDLKSTTAHRAGYKIILDDMTISAGIAGGKKFTPFIITRDGDLSGSVVNTAARLQGRANELSETRSRILVSRSLTTCYDAEIRQRQATDPGLPVIEFCKSGWISFKGIAVAVCEVVYDPAERYRLDYEPDLDVFLKAVQANNWKDGLFCSLLDLLVGVYEKMPPFKIPDPTGAAILANVDFIRNAQTALDRFRRKQDYRGAIADLAELVTLTKTVPNFDLLVLEYAEKITGRYRDLAAAFAVRFDAKVAERAPVNLPIKFRNLYAETERALDINRRLRAQVEASLTPLDLSLLWSSAVDASITDYAIAIHSGKR